MDMKKSILIGLAKSNMTRKELCEKAGVTNPYLSYVLHGKMTPKVSTVERIAWAFNMSVSEFIALGEE